MEVNSPGPLWVWGLPTMRPSQQPPRMWHHRCCTSVYPVKSQLWNFGDRCLMVERPRRSREKNVCKTYSIYYEINKLSVCPSGKLQYKTVECRYAGGFLGIWTMMEEFMQPFTFKCLEASSKLKDFEKTWTWHRWPIQPCLLKKIFKDQIMESIIKIWSHLKVKIICVCIPRFFVSDMLM